MYQGGSRLQSFCAPSWLRTLLLALVAAAFSALLTGCGGQAIRGTLRLNLSHDPADHAIYVPQPPAVPRYLLAGELWGEANFREDSRTMTAARRAFAWLVGLLDEPVEEMNLVRPQSGTVDDRGRILVTDVGRPGVFVFDEKEHEMRFWSQATPDIHFVSPTGIVGGANGETWVSDPELGAVFRLAADGTPVGAIGVGLLQRPNGLARDAAKGRLYVADTRANEIKVFDDAGRLIQAFGRAGETGGELNTPTYLAYADGQLYVTDTFNGRVQVFDEEGNFLRQFGSRGTYVGQMPRPKGITLDDEGNIYVVESYFDHVLIFNEQADFLLGLDGNGHLGDTFYLPAGIWTDSKNRIFVADMFRGRVVIFQFLGARDG